jgi:prepilin-type N-terminal cleavage/methylation domain-containing protein
MRGITLIELLIVLALIGIVSAMALPMLNRAIDEGRVRGAAFYLAGRCGWLRLAAVHRNANVAFKFEPAGGSWRYQAIQDGDWDGVRSADIAAGRDVPVSDLEQIESLFAGVRFGFAPGCPLIDGSPTGSASPVRVGSARMLTFSNAGTSNGGTLYLTGAQHVSGYAVVILGATGRTRLLRCVPGSGRWQGDAR